MPWTLIRDKRFLECLYPPWNLTTRVYSKIMLPHHIKGTAYLEHTGLASLQPKTN